jgi:AraC family transcriptional regulator, regulatory protein of adaptative response / DNA-3-methyladenine glycosylase II
MVLSRPTPYQHPVLRRRKALERALNARDPRFDGLFFVGIITTRIYCRPVCPARVAYTDHRRFFNSAAAAERAGYRPCLRCRPELAPGRALIDAVPRLADAAAHRIAAGALNGRGVGELASELGVSERHLRRALERELGVSPVELAQTHRLLLAKRLLADTTLSVTHVAYASGFQSLRRFNAAFRAQYRMPPSALRARAATNDGAAIVRANPPRRQDAISGASGLVRLTLSYRPPLAWDALVRHLGAFAAPGAEVVEGTRYGRTVRVDGRTGLVFAEDAATRRGATRKPQLDIDVSPSLVPVLMPLLVRLRQLFDLDAEPAVIDADLSRGGLGALVRQRPGLRLPGAIDGFDAVLVTLLAPSRSRTTADGTLARVVDALGEPIDAGHPRLTRIMPTSERVLEAQDRGLLALGVTARTAHGLVAVAQMLSSGALRLEPGSDVAATRRALRDVDGVSERAATLILMRALHWPDAFPETDRRLRAAAAVSTPGALLAQAERWQPWRAYAAHHLWGAAAP